MINAGREVLFEREVAGRLAVPGRAAFGVSQSLYHSLYDLQVVSIEVTAGRSSLGALTDALRGGCLTIKHEGQCVIVRAFRDLPLFHGGRRAPRSIRLYRPFTISQRSPAVATFSLPFRLRKEDNLELYVRLIGVQA